MLISREGFLRIAEFFLLNARILLLCPALYLDIMLALGLGDLLA